MCASDHEGSAGTAVSPCRRAGSHQTSVRVCGPPGSVVWGEAPWLYKPCPSGGEMTVTPEALCGSELVTFPQLLPSFFFLCQWNFVLALVGWHEGKGSSWALLSVERFAE